VLNEVPGHKDISLN